MINYRLLLQLICCFIILGNTASFAQDVPEATMPLARQVSEEAKAYQAVKAGVVAVECDFGSGSGFVVDPRGLILTNQHVTNGTNWAAIRFDRGQRYNAQVVIEDKAANVAVLCFNPAAYTNFEAISLADPSLGPIAVEGEKVVAIGSHLHQEKVLSIGIVSKVESGILMSDVDISYGNSGGPLINLAGEAIGINTFRDYPDNFGGSGISGIVSIESALPLLERAKQILIGMNMNEIPKDLLPDISTNPIAPEMLTNAAESKREKKPFLIRSPRNFETLVYTPFIVASLEAHQERELTKNQKRRMVKGRNSEYFESFNQSRRFWGRYSVNDYDPVVTIMVRPTLKETAGSVFNGLLSTLSGNSSAKRLEFRTDFYDMELYRGGVLIQPVRRQRDRVEQIYNDLNIEVKDAAYAGVYFYDPSAFEPGQTIELKIRRSESLNKQDTVSLDKKVQKEVWEQFAAYRGEEPSDRK